MTDASIIPKNLLLYSDGGKIVKEFRISIRSFAQVQSFVALATKQPFQVLVGSGENRVNGKNFMGMFTLDFSAPLQVQVDCDEGEFQKFRKAAAQFVCA